MVAYPWAMVSPRSPHAILTRPFQRMLTASKTLSSTPTAPTTTEGAAPTAVSTIMTWEVRLLSTAAMRLYSSTPQTAPSALFMTRQTSSKLIIPAGSSRFAMTAASARRNRTVTGKSSTASTQMALITPLVQAPMPTSITALLLAYHQTTSATVSHGTPKTTQQVKSASTTSRFAPMVALISRNLMEKLTVTVRPRKATPTTKILQMLLILLLSHHLLNASGLSPP